MDYFKPYSLVQNEAKKNNDNERDTLPSITNTVSSVNVAAAAASHCHHNYSGQYTSAIPPPMSPFSQVSQLASPVNGNSSQQQAPLFDSMQACFTPASSQFSSGVNASLKCERTIGQHSFYGGYMQNFDCSGLNSTTSTTHIPLDPCHYDINTQHQAETTHHTRSIFTKPYGYSFDQEINFRSHISENSLSYDPNRNNATICSNNLTVGSAFNKNFSKEKKSNLNPGSVSMQKQNFPNSIRRDPKNLAQTINSTLPSSHLLRHHKISSTNTTFALTTNSSTPPSAMSSREGTPLPSIAPEPPAPNVDISHFQLKEINTSNHYADFSPPPPPNSLAPTTFAQHQVLTSNPLMMRHHHLQNVYSSGFYAQGNNIDDQNNLTMQQNNNIPQRGRPSGSSSCSSSSGHGQVKIGRRPAHLPKVLKHIDKTLPHGWIRKLKQRKHGKQAGRWDVYIYSPCGVKFASRKKLKSFFEKNNLPFDPEDFDFTPYGRHIDARVASGTGSSSVTTSSSTSSGHPSGGSAGESSSASRHNSSGSTGSDGTNPGSSSSPASISNYSPTHSSLYLPPVHASFTVGIDAHASVPLSGFHPSPNISSELSSFAQFDPQMNAPPNACALDVPKADTSLSIRSGFFLSSSHATESCVGRGNHHPMGNKELGGAGSDFFPPAEMEEIMERNASDMVSGFSSIIVTTSSKLPVTTIVHGDSTSSSSINIIGVENCQSEKQMIQSNAAARTLLSTNDNTSVVDACESRTNNERNRNVIHELSSSNSTPQKNNKNDIYTCSQSNTEKSSFSLGRTMSVLQEDQEGFEYFYD